MKDSVRMLKRKAVGLILAGGVALALPFPARGAAALYSQTSDFPSSTAFASQTDTNGVGDPNTAYDDFTLTNTSVITGMTWRGGYVLPANPAVMASFTVTF